MTNHDDPNMHVPERRNKRVDEATPANPRHGARRAITHA
jgi:hypothetical protein